MMGETYGEIKERLDIEHCGAMLVENIPADFESYLLYKIKLLEQQLSAQPVVTDRPPTALLERLRDIADYIKPDDLPAILDAIEQLSAQPVVTDAKIKAVMEDWYYMGSCGEVGEKVTIGDIRDLLAALQTEGEAP